MKKIPQSIKNSLLKAQKSEITEHLIYYCLANKTKNKGNKAVLLSISMDEKKHYDYWKKYTEKDIKPDNWKIKKYYWISKIFGLTFGLKLMEKGESIAQNNYSKLINYIPEIKEVLKDEKSHEKKLIQCINEEKLKYIGSIVLGLNDALVELTGTLAGLTFALQNNKLVGIAGLITGIAASLSMAASEYLSRKAEEDEKALKSALYTGIAYIITVVLMITPFFIFKNALSSLVGTLLIVIAIIAFFNFYLSIAKNHNFKKKFLEMATISLGVAFISFIIGYIIRITLNIET